jgi:protein involved in polysaccharide export with SLBB domain
MLKQGKSDAPEGRFLLKNGDVVMFPAIEAKFMVIGAVTKPNVYPLPETKPMTLPEALAIAGGPISMGAEMRKASLMRTVDGKQVNIQINLQKMLLAGNKPASDLVIQNGDVLYIPQKGRTVTWVEALQPFIALGALGFRPF